MTLNLRFLAAFLKKKVKRKKKKKEERKKEDNVTLEIITGTCTVYQIHEICIDQRAISQHTMYTVLPEFSVSDFSF